MTYEKKYKESVEKLRYKISDNNGNIDYKAVVNAEELQDIFPELAESEDERIKREIVRYINLHKNDERKSGEWIAWLEKQGEKPQGKTALEAIHEEKVDNANKVEPPQEIDGFEVELNSLLKKYEHLPKEELQESLEFYLGVVRDDLDIVREDKPKWSEEDEIGSDETIELLEYFINYAPEFRKPAIGRSVAWLNSIKQRLGGEE